MLLVLVAGEESRHLWTSCKKKIFFFNLSHVLLISSLSSDRCVCVQGAYTGVCSQQHVPSYKSHIDKFKAKGIDSVICVSVNDPYTINGWADKIGAKDAVSSYFFFVCVPNITMV